MPSLLYRRKFSSNRPSFHASNLLVLQIFQHPKAQSPSTPRRTLLGTSPTSTSSINQLPSSSFGSYACCGGLLKPRCPLYSSYVLVLFIRLVLGFGAGVLGISSSGVLVIWESGGDGRPCSSWSDGTSIIIDGWRVNFGGCVVGITGGDVVLVFVDFARRDLRDSRRQIVERRRLRK